MYVASNGFAVEKCFDRSTPEKTVVIVSDPADYTRPGSQQYEKEWRKAADEWFADHPEEK